MGIEIDKATIFAERLRRQRFVEPLENPDDYTELFRLLQPVSPMASSVPGDPPRLVHRTAFDNGAVADGMRENRTIIKGRFLGGTVGYVLAEDLELYANAFRRQLSELSDMQQTVMNLLQYAGPLTPRQFKEETGFLNKQIMPALHRLQQAFLVYEDQVDSDWDRSWYDFATEWPEVNLDEGQWKSAAAEVLRRFLHAHVFATMEHLKDWSRFSSRPLKKLVDDVEGNNIIVPLKVEGLGEGWILAEDVSLKACTPQRSVFMLHKSDFLVRSHVSELKRRFGEYEVLQYLLIDGSFQGAVLGHWRIGPHDVDDIIVELPAAEIKGRCEEILKAVKWGYQPPRSNILNYDGEAVET
jgi:hypothetical protein